MTEVALLYRGPLESCNYGCAYCPFAKRVESAEELDEDPRALERFVGWVRARPESDRISVLFIPWGEALVRSWYQDALAALTRMPQVAKAAIQTNLSCGTEWIDRCDAPKLGLWATWHPEWCERHRFAEKVRSTRERGARISAGVVGFRRHLPAIFALRRELPQDVYLWINAVKHRWGPRRENPPEDYTAEEIRSLESIDPWFGVSLRDHESLGQSCRTGSSVVTVNGDGELRRCPFVGEPIGNLYEAGLEAALRERPCPNSTCGCHIGYVHLDSLRLREVFGEGILERVPAAPWR